MDILCIDLGSYSVKYLKGKTDRRIFEVLDYGEIVLNDVLNELGDTEASILDAQVLVLKTLFENKTPDTKVVFQIPYYLSTSRYFNLPITNKRKAEMMLPFQLEDNLPYPLMDTHYCFSLHREATHTKAKVHISKISEFDSYYNLLTQNNILPAVLSTESALIQNSLENESPSGTYMILDIGHETTNSYFIYNHQLVSSHVSHIAGHTINDVISKMYNISYEEASKYKHDNCFFLTKSQLDEVTEEQKEFALIMTRAMEPLVAEVKRWDLGHRVKFGAHVNRVYITGGTTKIKNFDNFLAEAVSLPIERLTHFPTMQLDESGEDDFSIYQMIKFHATSQLSKAPTPNFLSGKYNSDFTQNIPLHSTAFIFTRVVILAIVVISFLLVENMVFLKGQDSKLYKRTLSVLKTPELGIDSKKRRLLKRNADKVLSIIKKKADKSEKEYNALANANEVDATKAFLSLNSILSNNPLVSLVNFSSSAGSISGKFKSEDDSELKKLSDYLKTLNLKDFDFRIDKINKILEFEYQD